MAGLCTILIVRHSFQAAYTAGSPLEAVCLTRPNGILFVDRACHVTPTTKEGNESGGL
jgi:hypothetical protein